MEVPKGSASLTGHWSKEMSKPSMSNSGFSCFTSVSQILGRCQSHKDPVFV